MMLNNFFNRDYLNIKLPKDFYYYFNNKQIDIAKIYNIKNIKEKHDKIFSSIWLDDYNVVYGTKDSKLVLYNIQSNLLTILYDNTNNIVSTKGIYDLK